MTTKRKRAETVVHETKNATPVRRGRGRPRKNPLPSVAQDVLDHELPGEFSDDDVDGTNGLTRLGLNGDDQDSGGEEGVGDDGDASSVDETPQPKGKRKPGRPKGARARRQKTPSPPPDMPPYEQYFFQNRPGGLKTSGSTLSSMDLLTHEAYYDAMQRWQDPHQDDMDYLHHLHSRAFDQWLFELQEGFSLCLYGWGSKRMLLSAFAEFIALKSKDAEAPKILIINGFNPSLGARDILSSVAGAVPSLKNTKLGAQPADMVSTILAALSSEDYSKQPIHMLIHSVDAPPLRRPASQSILAQLAEHELIRLAFTADTPTFPLMWDARLRSEMRLLYHDATTFQSFAQEISVGNGGGGIVDQVLGLMGRSGRRVHGREGVVFVLRSLTESARRLFGLLVSEVLSAGDDAPIEARREDDDDDFERALASSSAGAHPRGAGGQGIEYRALYRKAVQQLVTSSEVGFRQLLKEFYDHEMLLSRRDGSSSTEILSLPFRKEELEAILEDLVLADDA